VIKAFRCLLCKSELMDRHSFREHMRKVHYKKTDLIYFEDSKGNRIKQPWVEEVCY